MEMDGIFAIHCHGFYLAFTLVYPCLYILHIAISFINSSTISIEIRKEVGSQIRMGFERAYCQVEDCATHFTCASYVFQISLTLFFMVKLEKTCCYHIQNDLHVVKEKLTAFCVFNRPSKIFYKLKMKIQIKGLSLGSYIIKCTHIGRLCYKSPTIRYARH